MMRNFWTMFTLAHASHSLPGIAVLTGGGGRIAADYIEAKGGISASRNIELTVAGWLK